MDKERVLNKIPIRYFVILIVFVVVALSGCLGTSEQNPRYYDEKAIYVMNSSLSVLREDVAEFNPSQLSKHSQNYYHEIDKLIVSPSLQPAVDAYKQAMVHFNSAADFYSDNYKTCYPPTENVDILIKIYNECIESNKNVKKQVEQKLQEGITSLTNAIGLIP